MGACPINTVFVDVGGTLRPEVAVERLMAEWPAGHEERREVLPPFEHARELLAGIKDLGWRCVVLSNTVRRDAEMYRREFAAAGYGHWVDDYVTSVDAGFSKPDVRIFRAALEVAGADPRQCVMIGNSEEADIAPAKALGMRTLRVAVEGPTPVLTAADALVTRLDDALEVLKIWACS